MGELQLVPGRPSMLVGHSSRRPYAIAPSVPSTLPPLSYLPLSTLSPSSPSSSPSSHHRGCRLHWQKMDSKRQHPYRRRHRGRHGILHCHDLGCDIDTSKFLLQDDALSSSESLPRSTFTRGNDTREMYAPDPCILDVSGDEAIEADIDFADTTKAGCPAEHALRMLLDLEPSKTSVPNSPSDDIIEVDSLSVDSDSDEGYFNGEHPALPMLEPPARHRLTATFSSGLEEIRPLVRRSHDVTGKSIPRVEREVRMRKRPTVNRGRNPSSDKEDPDNTDASGYTYE